MYFFNVYSLDAWFFLFICFFFHMHFLFVSFSADSEILPFVIRNVLTMFFQNLPKSIFSNFAKSDFLFK